AAVNVGSGTGSSSLTGAIYSGTQVILQSGVTLTYAPFLPCTTPNVNAGTDKVLTCTNPTAVLNGSSSTLGATFSWTAINGGNIVSGGATATPTINSTGSYILTVTTSSGGCTAKD